MNIKHIIVQANIRGERFEYLTANKPKALIPIGNLPVLFHLFKKFSGSHFVIIGGYKADVLKTYLSALGRVF